MLKELIKREIREYKEKKIPNQKSLLNTIGDSNFAERSI